MEQEKLKSLHIEDGLKAILIRVTVKIKAEQILLLQGHTFILKSPSETKQNEDLIGFCLVLVRIILVFSFRHVQAHETYSDQYKQKLNVSDWSDFFILYFLFFIDIFSDHKTVFLNSSHFFLVSVLIKRPKVISNPLRCDLFCFEKH